MAHCVFCRMQRSCWRLLWSKSHAYKSNSWRSFSKFIGTSFMNSVSSCSKYNSCRRTPIHQTLAGRCYSSENACKSDDENERLYGKWELPDIDLDWDYLSDPGNRDAIKMNILNRKGVGNINKLVE